MVVFYYKLFTDILQTTIGAKNMHFVLKYANMDMLSNYEHVLLLQCEYMNITKS